MASGSLQVDETHQIYYETYGSADGIPILFIHGGPGYHFSDRDQRFFDPVKHYVIFFDQRGCGRSTPTGSIESNTTKHLLADIDLLLNHLQVNQVHLFGGSWGSSLSLIYAIHNPNCVLSMILRGIFLASSAAKAFLEMGGIAQFYPKWWQRYIDQVPTKFRSNPTKYYFEQIKSADPKVANHYAFESMLLPSVCSALHIDPSTLENDLKNTDYLTHARLQYHYSANNFFVEENYILDNLKPITHIPTQIVHGRYDMLCLTRDAQNLHDHLENSKLHIVTAGHSSGESEIERTLIQFVDQL